MRAHCELAVAFCQDPFDAHRSRAQNVINSRSCRATAARGLAIQLLGDRSHLFLCGRHTPTIAADPCGSAAAFLSTASIFLSSKANLVGSVRSSVGAGPARIVPENVVT